MQRMHHLESSHKAFDFYLRVCMQATSLHLMVEGVALLTASRSDGTTATSSLYSGYLFNLAICNVFGVYIGLERAPIECVCPCCNTAFTSDALKTPCHPIGPCHSLCGSRSASQPASRRCPFMGESPVKKHLLLSCRGWRVALELIDTACPQLAASAWQ